MRGQALVQPTGMLEVPGFEVRVLETPRGHLLNRPLRCGLVIWRTSQPWAIEIREHMHGLHDLRMFHGFFANAAQHVAAAILCGDWKREERENKRQGDNASFQHLLSPGNRLGWIPAPKIIDYIHNNRRMT